MDFNKAEDLERFMEADADEKRELLDEGLADIAAEWMGDGVDDVLARSIVGAMRSYMEGALVLDPDMEDKPNPYIIGVWQHGFTRMVTTFQTLAGITGVMKNMKKKGD